MGKRIQELVLKDLNKKVLELGYVGENIHTQIIIDCSEVFWDYPNAVPRLKVTPPRGDKYLASQLVKDGDNLIWTITDSDVIYSGSGRIQLRFVDGNEVIMTAVGTTKIDGSIETTGDAPTPLEDWMDRAEETAEQIAENAAATVLENYDELVDDVSSLKSAIALMQENIPGTVQTIAFDSAGNVQSITHTENNVAVRTDVFTFGTNTITEVRTLNTGESLTIVTNTNTLETTTTYAAA